MARTKKEQMQMLILGAMLAAGGLFAAVNFLLAPMINNWKKDSAQTLALQAKLDAARAVEVLHGALAGRLEPGEQGRLATEGIEVVQAQRRAHLRREGQ